MMYRLFVRWLAFLLSLAGCSVITPPPMAPRYAPPAPVPEGAASAMLIVGVGGGVFIDSGWGLELRGAYQVSEHVEVGAGVGFAKNMEKRARHEKEAAPSAPSERLEHLVAARVFATWFPGEDVDWMCVTTGAGVGAGSTGLRYLTFDLDWTGGYTNDARTGAGYGSVIGSVSIPLEPGRAFNNETNLPVLTWHVGASGGGWALASSDNFTLAGQLTVLWAFAQETAGLIFLTGAAGYQHRP
jgi:hypothetical protein